MRFLIALCTALLVSCSGKPDHLSDAEQLEQAKKCTDAGLIPSFVSSQGVICRPIHRAEQP